MIDELDKTLARLLKSEIENYKFEVKFEQPTREKVKEWGSQPIIDLFLYDLRENNVLREHQWERLPAHPREDDKVRLRRSPLRVDCLYMLTTWGTNPADEHKLLAQAMMALFRYPILTDKYMSPESALRSQLFPIPTHLASHDRLTNPAEVWSALDNEMRPSVSYIITLAMDPWIAGQGDKVERAVETVILRQGVAIELPLAPGPWTEEHGDKTEPAAHTVVTREGKAVAVPLPPGTPLSKRRLVHEPHSGDTIYIGGTVWAKDEGNVSQPVAGVTVIVEGTALCATTDDQGHYRLGSLEPGPHTLVAKVGREIVSRKRILIPALPSPLDRVKYPPDMVHDDYDLVLKPDKGGMSPEDKSDA